MIANVSEFGDLLSVVLTVALFGWAFWAFSRRRKSREVPDGPQREPYRVYTRDHDLIVPASAVPQVLVEKGLDHANNWTLRDPEIWRRKVVAAREISAQIDATGALGEQLGRIFAPPTRASDWAICLLVDQSGSMRDEPILHVSASVRWLSAQLGEIGVAAGIFGFSTVGWKGGRARQDWLWNGQPKRPGRLCALLHVIYQPIGATFEDQDWEAMLHPDVLRENVDGEAIEWAANTLGAVPAKHRLLIVISDGAPVDDSTLDRNGPSYLSRHVKMVIAETQAREDIILGAVGVNYRVDGFYRLSRTAAELVDVPRALCDVIAEAVERGRDQQGE